MKRYVTRKVRSADIDGEADAEDYLSRTVFEQEHGPVSTGILDKHGNELFSIIEPSPIGFLKNLTHSKRWSF